MQEYNPVSELMLIINNLQFMSIDFILNLSSRTNLSPVLHSAVRSANRASSSDSETPTSRIFFLDCKMDKKILKIKIKLIKDFNLHSMKYS